MPHWLLRPASTGSSRFQQYGFAGHVQIAGLSEQQCGLLGRLGLRFAHDCSALHSLSGRVALLSWPTAEKPALLVLDEPTNHLDLMRQAYGRRWALCRSGFDVAQNRDC